MEPPQYVKVAVGSTILRQPQVDSPPLGGLQFRISVALEGVIAILAPPE
jgi:hypothetical protein